MPAGMIQVIASVNHFGKVVKGANANGSSPQAGAACAWHAG
jgi:hypothetical protein